MSTVNVALLGLGTVGTGVYETIKSHEEQLQGVIGKKVSVQAVLIKDASKKRDVAGDVLVTDRFEEILELGTIEVVLEATGGLEPAFTYLKQALQKGCHVITANKEMYAYHGEELEMIAAQHAVSVRFEATVAGGVPIIQTLQHLVNVNRVKKIQGILNGTSNFILTTMREEGLPFSEALKMAQHLGYAEADPTNDIEGYDAFYKLMILSRVSYGMQPVWNAVDRSGISFITSEQIRLASEVGLRFKHIAEIEYGPDGLKGTVKPVLVADTHPFYHIEGVDNAINIEGDIVGNITLQGPGAGKLPTASAMIEDLVQVVKNRQPITGPLHREVPAHAGGDDYPTWLLFSEHGFSHKDLAGFKSASLLHEKAVIVKAEAGKLESYFSAARPVAAYAVEGNIALESLPLASGLHYN
ncbi:homoserine dehydrogenase [Bacillus marinisedimentorum]|uniref:homoserine dehydrogenase n=1 Tax=Bacillus marinisedimentorum TaxID=1821260 RepID=UPI000871E37F|nr:homoserine dehydrogenase [Bacillus marinisedimentorum]